LPVLIFCVAIFASSALDFGKKERKEKRKKGQSQYLG
jgi:hypothetical protein